MTDMIRKSDALAACAPLYGWSIAAAEELEAAIAALPAVTIARLTGEVASWRMASTEAEKEVAAVRAQRVSAEAKVAALAAALEEIASYDTGATAGLAYTAKAALAAYEGRK